MLARGPWALERVKACWCAEEFEPPSAHTEAADAAIRGLQDRGSPSHDGLAARLVGYREEQDGLAIDLQPLRWALRLVDGDASASVAALCVTRSADGRWLAGRRAAWVASTCQWPAFQGLPSQGIFQPNPARTSPSPGASNPSQH